LVGEQRSKRGNSHYPRKYAEQKTPRQSVPVLLEKVEEICANVTGIE